jgi:hypothetical protein
VVFREDKQMAQFNADEMSTKFFAWVDDQREKYNSDTIMMLFGGDF